MRLPKSFSESILDLQSAQTDYVQPLIGNKKLDIRIYNSQTSNSGRVDTAGFILLKAPNTANRHRYTQSLHSLLPDTTPYFDVLRYAKTPMDQVIPHLAIQCGERHVTPLCQALLSLLDGRGNALFLPRYAFSTMTNDKIRNHFKVHEMWSHSLKTIILSPQINHLDQV
jgi:hypothetical protein